MATHSDVIKQMPFVCDICNKRFATSQFLETHRFKHRTKVQTNIVSSESGSILEKIKNEVKSNP